MFSSTGTRSDSGIGRPKLQTLSPMLSPVVFGAAMEVDAKRARSADSLSITRMSATATCGE